MKKYCVELLVRNRKLNKKPANNFFSAKFHWSSIFFVLFMIMILFSFGCSGTKVGKYINNLTPVKIKNRRNNFLNFYANLKNEAKEINSRAEKKWKNIYKEFKKFNPEIHKISCQVKTEPFPTIIDCIGPAISNDGKFIAGLSKIESDEYDLQVRYIPGQSEVTISNLTDAFHDGIFSNHFPILKWSPSGNCLAYISSEDGYNNVCLAFIKFNEEDFLVEFISFKITNNTSEKYYYDFDWSKDGRFLSFTDKNYEQERMVRFFDLEKAVFCEFDKAKDLSSFRFGREDEEAGFCILESNSEFIPCYIDDFREIKNEGNITNEHFHLITELKTGNPFFWASFAGRTRNIAIQYYTEDNRFCLAVYDYKNKSPKTKENQNTTDIEYEYFYPFGSPLWKNNDLVLFWQGRKKIFASYPQSKNITIESKVTKNNEINSLISNIMESMYFSEYDYNVSAGYPSWETIKLYTEISMEKLPQKTESEKYNVLVQDLKLDKAGNVIEAVFLRESDPLSLSEIKTALEIGILYENAEFSLDKKQLENFKSAKRIQIEWPEKIKKKKIKVKIILEIEGKQKKSENKINQ